VAEIKLYFYSPFATNNQANDAGLPTGLLTMKRGRHNPSQLQIDFLASYRAVLVSLGKPENLPLNESLFVRLTDQWETTRQLPKDLLFQKSPVDAVVFRLRKTDERLQFPTEMVAGEIRGIPGLTGFAATFRAQGWIILPAELTGPYKNLFLNILTAAIGLENHYDSRPELLTEAERVALAALLPDSEIRKFFGIKLSRFPDSFRAEVTNYFNLPFDYVLKRANHLGAVSEAVLDDAALGNRTRRRAA
jgi:hypothetical protein